MPDLPAPDAHDPRADFIPELRRLLADPEFHTSALSNALEAAEAAAFAAWEREEDRPAVERMRIALQAAREELERLGSAL